MAPVQLCVCRGIAKVHDVIVRLITDEYGHLSGMCAVKLRLVELCLGLMHSSTLANGLKYIFFVFCRFQIVMSESTHCRKESNMCIIHQVAL